MKNVLRPEKILRRIKEMCGETQWAAAILQYRSRIRKTSRGFVYVKAAASHVDNRSDQIVLTGVTTYMENSMHLKGTEAQPKKRPRKNTSQGQTATLRAQIDECSDLADLRQIAAPLRVHEGRDRGSLIHQQMHDLLIMDEETFFQVHQYGAHPWSAAGMAKMITVKKWWPLKSELLVGDLETGLATPIDQVACTRRGHLVVIETKSGYAGGRFDRVDGQEWKLPSLKAMEKYEGFCPCQRHRAILQLMLGADMLMRMWSVPYPLAHLHLYILRISSSRRPEFYRVPRRLFIQYMPAIRRDILNSRRE